VLRRVPLTYFIAGPLVVMHCALVFCVI